MGLLELFLRNPHRIFSQSCLLETLWSFDAVPSESTVRTHIKSLRQKLKKAGATGDLIETVYGLGYRFNQNVNQQFTSQTVQKQHKSDKKNAVEGRLVTIWRQQKPQYLGRVEVLSEAVKAMLTGNCSPKLREEAENEAHTLAGSLGIFGLVEESEQSREIEQILVAQEKLPRSKVKKLCSLVGALRESIEGAEEGVTTGNVVQVRTSDSSLRLLIVDDDAVVRRALAKEAIAWKMEPETAENVPAARKACYSNKPDVILLDLSFSQEAEDGFELLKELNTVKPPIPVLVFTARDSFADRVKVARLGGRGFLHKPIPPSKVMEAIAQVMEQSRPNGAKITMVDDDPQMLDWLRQLLSPWGFQLTLLDEPKEFWQVLQQSCPDLLILDIQMPSFSGLELCQVMRNDPLWQDLPVLFLSAQTDPATVQKVFAVGADDYIQKPIVGPELIARILNRLERSHIKHKS